MNATDRLAAQRYAAAYDALSTSPKQAAVLAEDLRSAVQALQTVHNYMTDPRVSLTAKKELVRSSLASQAQTASFIELLLEAKRYKLLAEISARVDALLDERQGIVRAEIFAARPLTQAQRTETIKTLSSRYNKMIHAVFRTDESLLGGLLVLCNGERIDGSLRGRLEKLQEELTQ